jgi:hypothetical protein
MKRIVIALTLLTTPARAFEFKYPQGCIDDRTAGAELLAREASHQRIIPADGGWYKSCGTLFIASPKACIVPGSDVQALFHGAHARRGGMQAVTRDSPWQGFVPGDVDPYYRGMMQRSPWGKRIYAHILRSGWLDTPAYSTLYGDDLMRLGVPVCKGN